MPILQIGVRVHYAKTRIRCAVYNVSPAVMAYRDSTSTRLPHSHQLRPFILHDVKPTGKQLGCGSYGIVEEVTVAGLVCAGKKIYDILIDPENLGAEAVISKYYRECSLLSEVRHPHVVQFMGISFLPGSQFPMLVMEKMQTSLDNLLETTPDIPLGIKVSILQDVARGLVFLHNRSPAVIHRDLTARNVLLNSALRAKIGDLGNSRITNILPGQLAQTMTKGIPGTLVYMPPEASTDYYGPPLDIFSLGHLSLFAVIQVFPGDLLASSYTRRGSIKARTELQRREDYITILDNHLGKKDPLVVLIKQCLEHDSSKRPTATGTLERLEKISETHKDPYKHMTRLELEREIDGITEMKRNVKDIKSQLLQTESEKQSLWKMSQGKEDILAAKHQEIALLRKKLDKAVFQQVTLESSIAVKEADITKQKSDISSLEEKLSLAQKKVQSLETEGKENIDMLSVKEKAVSALHAELAGLKNLLDQGGTHERETNRNSVQLVKIIGAGQLAEVWEGVWNSTTPVAVKIPKQGDDEALSTSLVEEGEVMKKFLNHKCIVQIFATCLTEKPYYIVTELMKHGNLLGYLHNEGEVLKTADLIHIMAQVACGMAGIESLGNYVHLNLKAANVLVCDKLICKVGGFGYIKTIAKCSKNDLVFPIRWTAPEVYSNSHYSIKASVWSFGVLMYEVITKGESPYPGMENHVVMKKLLGGYRMPRPYNCPVEIYDLMLRCWKENPSYRPNFRTIETLLNDFTKST